ncbi:MAG: PrsW family glutamic-type intramembrane protease, partial [Candidatus Absconditabacterales bacterium]
IIFVILLTMIFKNRYKKIIEIIFIFAVFFILISYAGYFSGIGFLMLYYLISAYAEEYMKFSAANNLFFSENRKNQTDLIFFCILVGLGFGLIENIFYIVNAIIVQHQSNVLNLIVGRGLISTLLHVVCSGLIAFISIKIFNSKKIIISTLIGIIFGFGLHSLYNMSLNYKSTYLTVSIVVLCFFLLTYLFFHSDIVYKKTD